MPAAPENRAVHEPAAKPINANTARKKNGNRKNTPYLGLARKYFGTAPEPTKSKSATVDRANLVAIGRDISARTMSCHCKGSEMLSTCQLPPAALVVQCALEPSG